MPAIEWGVRPVFRPVMLMFAGMTGVAAVSATMAQAATDTVKPKLICKRSADTGSLIAKRRECRTKEEWDRIAEAARQNAQDQMDRNGGRPPGGL